MAYIYRKKVNGQSYYYLRISKRVGNKLAVKDVAYLGNELNDVEKKLDNLKKYQAEIRKSYANLKKFIKSNHFLEQIRQQKIKNNIFIDRKLLEQVEAARLHFNKHFLRQDKKTVSEAYRYFLIEFAFNTTSIEGNTITLKEATKLLEEDILPQKKTLREVYDLQNTEKVFFWLLESNPKFDEDLIVKVHDLLMDKIDERKGYRTHDIRVFKARFESSPEKYVAADMKILMKFFENNTKKLHPLVLAGMFHHKLEKIHPFADGNGRTGRMLLNYILLKQGYPPLIVPKRMRADYLDVLSRADAADLNNTDAKYYKSLMNYLAERMTESYWLSFNV